MRSGLIGKMAALLLAGTALCASAHAQEMTAAEGVDWYMGQFMSSMEQFENGSSAGLSGMSTVIMRISREPRLTAEDRVMAESQMRCIITQAIDQSYPDRPASDMAVFHRSYGSVMALDVVQNSTIEAPVDLTYAWQAAECLRSRYDRLMELGNNSGEARRQILHDRAARSLNTSVSLHVLAADSVARFSPDDLEEQIQSRLNANIRQFQAASAFRQHTGYSPNASQRLASANAYNEAIQSDLLAATGQINTGWINVKQTQVAGYLMYGEQTRAAELAREMVMAITAASADQRPAAIELARNLPAAVGVSEASTYLQTLDRLLRS